MISLRQVRKIYDDADAYAVDGVDLEIGRGELLVLLGESGCGKTTTLKMINRLIEPTEGEIIVDGRDTRESDPVRLRRRIGYVFQGIGLFPHMTIAENVAIVPALLGWGADDRRARTIELLQLVGMDPEVFANRTPRRLSGGQRQRAGLARALAARPSIMLMDEPFGALDPLTRDDLQKEFRSIHNRLDLTTVMVTHDMTEALLMADRVAIMSEGRIVSLGTPHEMLTKPGDAYAERLMDMPREHSDRLEALMAAAPSAPGASGKVDGGVGERGAGRRGDE